MRLAVMVIAADETKEQVQRAIDSALDFVIPDVLLLGNAKQRIWGRGDVGVRVVQVSNESLLGNRCELVQRARDLGATHGLFLDADDAFLPTALAGVAAADALAPEASAVFFDTLQVVRGTSFAPAHQSQPFLSMAGPAWAGWPLWWFGQMGLVTPSIVLSNQIAGAGAVLFRLDAWPTIEEVGHRWGGEDLLYTAALAATPGRKAVAIRIPTVAYSAPGEGNLANDWRDGGTSLADAILVAEKRGYEFECMYDIDWHEVPFESFLARGLEWRPVR